MAVPDTVVFYRYNAAGNENAMFRALRKAGTGPAAPPWASAAPASGSRSVPTGWLGSAFSRALQWFAEGHMVAKPGQAVWCPHSQNNDIYHIPPVNFHFSVLEQDKHVVKAYHAPILTAQLFFT